MFFTELCFKNPEISSSVIIDNIYNYLTTKPSAEDYLKKVVRGYAGYIYETVNNYLKIFFKPTVTLVDVIDFTKKNDLKRISVLDDAIQVLVTIETMALLDPNFNLEKELKEVKKAYKIKTKNKGLTKEHERILRKIDKNFAFLYYKKRILQNYEEYSNYGKITDPILDESTLEIKEEEVVNPNIITKGKLTRELAKATATAKATTTAKTKAKTKKVHDYAGIYDSDYNKGFETTEKPKSTKVRKSSPNSKTKRIKRIKIIKE
jgi:hypothetical protein